MDNAEGVTEPVENPKDPNDKKKAKRDKVRSAWISFAGRIVAQIVGAVATVALGVMVLHRYTSTDTRPPSPGAGYEANAQSEHPDAAVALGTPAASGGQVSRPPATVIIITPGMLGLRDADTRTGTADRNCSPALDSPAAPTAHLTNGAYRPR